VPLQIKGEHDHPNLKRKCRNVQLSPELEEVAEIQQEVTAAIEAEERELEQMRMEGEQEELAAE
jgi:DNA-directed RNA polymerase subunit beta'